MFNICYDANLNCHFSPYCILLKKANDFIVVTSNKNVAGLHGCGSHIDSIEYYCHERIFRSKYLYRENDLLRRCGSHISPMKYICHERICWGRCLYRENYLLPRWDSHINPMKNNCHERIVRAGVCTERMIFYDVVAAILTQRNITAMR